MAIQGRTSESNEPTVHAVLSAVRRRMRRRNALHFASTGAAVGCFAAAVLACIGAAVVSIEWYWLAIVAATGTVFGSLAGTLIPVSLSRAAAVVDRYYLLKDRTITALQFATDPDPVRQMQVADTTRHLRQVELDDCVPPASSRNTLLSAAMFGAMAIAVMLFSNTSRSDALAARPVRLAAEQASSLRETMLEEIEQLRSKGIEQPELDELVEKLDDLLVELADESIDERDMMATLSEMEQAIAETRDALQLEVTDAQMKGIAEALQPAESLKQAAKAMEKGDYQAASEQLEAIDPANVTDKQRRAVADNLKKYLAKLSPGQKGQLSDAATEIQEGLGKKNDSQCKAGLCKLASLCKQQGNCKKIGDCMACQLNRLGQCKSQCRGNGSNRESENASKSDSPKNSWGKGASGAPNGGASTQLDATRREEQLEGVQGDGPSESEIIEAPEGEQDAVRQYAKRYQKFRSQAEAVLDSEPLPLGHRETVRQYFESIRPDKEALP